MTEKRREWPENNKFEEISSNLPGDLIIVEVPAMRRQTLFRGKRESRKQGASAEQYLTDSGRRVRGRLALGYTKAIFQDSDSQDEAPP